MDGVNSDWLRQLAPAHVPAAPGWWPLAPGWWLLVALLLACCAGWLIYYQRPVQRVRRAALRELKHIADAGGDAITLAGQLENLLRRYAATRFGRESVASLAGDDWIAFIAERGGKQLAGVTGSNLLRLAYGGTAPDDKQAWLAGARAFIKEKS